LRFASPSAEGLVRLDMARVAALKADLAMLEGTGGTQIKGLITYSDITSHTASTTGSNGDTLQPEDVALMEGQTARRGGCADVMAVPQELLLHPDEPPSGMRPARATRPGRSSSPRTSLGRRAAADGTVRHQGVRSAQVSNTAR